eukprot:14458348-Alexandrium_andersonii.AAC.1
MPKPGGQGRARCARNAKRVQRQGRTFGAVTSQGRALGAPGRTLAATPGRTLGAARRSCAQNARGLGSHARASPPPPEPS